MVRVLKVLNHNLTDEQLRALDELYDDKVVVEELPEEFKTFLLNTPPSEGRIWELANNLAAFIGRQEYDAVILPAGSPAFMFAFAQTCVNTELNERVDFLFAHSERQVVEKERPDGSVEKTSTFKFVKWIWL